MDLGAFLADDTLGGSWADEEVDMSSISVPTTGGPSGSAAPTSSYQRQESSDFERRDRVEYPVPNAPPYRARVANLPYDASDAALARFFEDRLQARDIVSDVKLPMDNLSGKIKGFAFVTFSEKAVLEEALNLSMSEFNGRKIFVNVAAPQKQDVFDLDWRSSRSGPMGGDRRDRDREPREQVELDWGAARSSSGPSQRERFERGDRPDRGDRPERRFRDEPELDWGSARASGPGPMAPRGDAPRERKPRREEPELDWGAARGTATLPPKERKPRREEADIDWSAARSGTTLPPRERSGPKRTPSEFGAAGARKTEKEFDWKRGQKLPAKEKPAAGKKDEKEQNKPQKSSFDVLALDDDEEEDEEEKEETGLEKPVSELSV